MPVKGVEGGITHQLQGCTVSNREQLFLFYTRAGHKGDFKLALKVPNEAVGGKAVKSCPYVAET